MAVGTAYRAAGQHDRAINELRQALEMSPARPRVHYQLGVTFVLMGRFAEAIGALEIAARPAPATTREWRPTWGMRTPPPGAPATRARC